MTANRPIANFEDTPETPAGHSSPAGNGHRPPPHDPALERGIVGAALVWAGDTLTALAGAYPHFYSVTDHSRVADAIVALHARGDTPTPQLVDHHLTSAGHQLGGLLTELQTDAPTPTALTADAARLADHAEARRLHHVAAELDTAARTLNLNHALTILGRAHEDTPTATIAWEDVAAAIRGDEPPLTPTILYRTDGRALIYPRLLHWLMGEPGKGKTWVALAAVLEQLALEQHVIYLDWEGNRRIIGDRLRNLGVPPHLAETHLHYLRPPTLNPALIRSITQQAGDSTLCVYDGVAKALARNDLDEDRAADVLAWLELAVHPITETGCAALVLDHVSKDKTQRGLWPRGSGAKQGEVSGAAWSLQPRQLFSRHQGGHFDLLQAKDREGHLAVDGDSVARFTVTPGTDTLNITIDPPDGNSTTTGGWDGPTHCMDAIVHLLTTTGEEISGAELERRLRAVGNSYRRKTILDAAEALTVQGRLTARTGPRNSRLFSIEKDRDEELF